MNNKLIGVALLVVGIALALWGYTIYDSAGSQISRAITGEVPVKAWVGMILGYEDEIASLKDKATGKVLFEDFFYGNPKCGLIDELNNWAIIAGEHISIWTAQKTHKIKQEGFI